VGENNFPKDDVNLLKTWPYCLASAVAYIHDQNIRHKNIKPSNITCKGLDIFLTDFGSAHQFSAGPTSSTEGYAVKLTKMYSAPEVIAFDRRGRSADIYSLGCVFAEMKAVAEGRKIEDFHDFRSEPVVDEPDRMTLAYHVTAHKLEAWFSLQDDDWPSSLPAKMMDSDKKLRPSAKDILAILSENTDCICRIQRTAIPVSLR
jgi:serine/threonine protein kinase